MTSKERVLAAFHGEQPDRIPTDMMPTRACMCAPTHMMQDNSSTENVVAMHEAVATLRQY